MKKVLGAAALGLVAVLALASSASAVEAIPGEGGVAPTPPGACVFSVTPATSTTFPVVVTVAGTAPVGVTATVYLDGVPKAGPTVIGAAGTFSFPGISVPSANTAITMSFTYGNKSAYTANCLSTLGDVVIRVKADSVAAAPLAFTGSSSSTPTYVLLGLAAVVIGLVMVVGVRRRASVRG
jgi:LPXTG-motif cell wall-anchored protein